MNFHEIDRLADHDVLPGLASVAARDRANTAEVLAFISVADERKLYLPAGYPSMYQYCLGELHMSEDSAAKRIQAARAARKCPAILEAVDAGRVHLSAVCLLAPHLLPANAEELIVAATHKSKAQIECPLAERFPRPDVPTLLKPIARADFSGGQVQENVCECDAQHAPGHVASPAHLPVPAQVELAAPGPRLTPLAPQRFALQVTLGQPAHDKLRRAQELLAHLVPTGDVEQLLGRALDVLIQQFEKRRLAVTHRPGTRRSLGNGRYIPAEVKRQVRARDGDQCAYVSASGHRCEERKLLEYDHVNAVARGGAATTGNLRLLCRAHNRHAAECAFGKGFMREKREGTRAARAALSATKTAPRVPDPERANALEAAAYQAVPWLRERGNPPTGPSA